MKKTTEYNTRIFRVNDEEEKKEYNEIMKGIGVTRVITHINRYVDKETHEPLVWLEWTDTVIGPKK